MMTPQTQTVRPGIGNNIRKLARLLPLPDLMRAIGDGHLVAQSAQCPFHRDSAPSFSVFRGADGKWRWQCFAHCGRGDGLDYLQLRFHLSFREALQMYNSLAQGATPNSRQRNTSTGTAGLAERSVPTSALPRLQIRCPSKVEIEEIAAWRGYRTETCQWLADHQLLAIVDEQYVAIPIHNLRTRAVTGWHYRREDGTWRYTPPGLKLEPLVIGDAHPRVIVAMESQWDAFAFIDRAELEPGMAIVVTRGAGNGKLLSRVDTAGAAVFAVSQNDRPRDDRETPAQRWLRDVRAVTGGNVFSAFVPQPHKDLNEWTRAGATATDIRAAMRSAALAPSNTITTGHFCPLSQTT